MILAQNTKLEILNRFSGLLWCMCAVSCCQCLYESTNVIQSNLLFCQISLCFRRFSCCCCYFVPLLSVVLFFNTFSSFNVLSSVLLVFFVCVSVYILPQTLSSRCILFARLFPTSSSPIFLSLFRSHSIALSPPPFDSILSRTKMIVFSLSVILLLLLLFLFNRHAVDVFPACSTVFISLFVPCLFNSVFVSTYG